MRRSKVRGAGKGTPPEHLTLELARSVFRPGAPILVRGRGACGRGHCVVNDEVVVESKYGPLIRFTCMRSGHMHVCKADDADIDIRKKVSEPTR